ncbi:MAG TPA: hybrid sensor histidine kinase/response regulator [Anaerolineae bacterium]|nr:hybrid sensor histidine kinase/response regulator [Anaerolineae bacterium]
MQTLDYSAHTVLIVDDNPQNLQLLADFLRAWKLRVLIARNGPDALKRAAQQLPDLILLDVMMPEMDGFTVCRQLQKDAATAAIPVIFMTALADGDNKVRGFEAGGVDYITKPFHQPEVLARVTAQLRIHQLTRALQAANADLEAKVAERTAALEKALETARILDARKNDFIDIISHELRTPLTVIQGYAQILHQMVTLPADSAAPLAAINTATQQLASVVDMVVEVARLNGDSLTLTPTWGNVNDVLQRVTRIYAAETARRRLTVTLQLGELPVAWMDTQALYQALEHVFRNAIKYTPDGGTITVSSATYADTGKQYVELVIRDTGIGIAPAEQRLIFEQFYRVGPVAHHSTGKTKFKGGGPGLGLTLARGIVEAHGGRIWVESPGYDETACPGSQFFIILPVQALASPESVGGATPAETAIL